MTQSGTITDKSKTINAWADIVLKIWRNNLIEQQVYDTGELMHSLLQTMLYNAGSDSNKVEFSFALHGVFVDAGVGGEISKGNGGDLGFDPVRKPKPWYSKALYGQIFRLREIMAEKYAIDAVHAITIPLNNYKNAK